MTIETQPRILAREVAHERELTLEELKLVAGGGNSTNNGMDCGPDWGRTHWCHCLASDADPCDLDEDMDD